MSIKVMSFNLRYDNEWDGENRFTKRLPRVIELIKNESPDIIGFQEVTEPMRKTLYGALDGYLFCGCGRDRDYHNGEAMLIAYRYDVIELIKCENVWLSETPNVPGSKYGGGHSGCPRMYTQLLLKHNDIESPFTFINTHLDHEGGRMLESEQLCRAIAKLDGHFVLTGDFNANPDDPEILHITESLSHKNAIDCTAGLGPTFHDFGRRTSDKQLKIDYIFTSAVCEGAYKIDDEAPNGLYYSDHNAVVALINLD